MPPAHRRFIVILSAAAVSALSGLHGRAASAPDQPRRNPAATAPVLLDTDAYRVVSEPLQVEGYPGRIRLMILDKTAGTQAEVGFALSPNPPLNLVRVDEAILHGLSNRLAVRGHTGTWAIGVVIDPQHATVLDTILATSISLSPDGRFFVFEERPERPPDAPSESIYRLYDVTGAMPALTWDKRQPPDKGVVIFPPDTERGIARHLRLSRFLWVRRNAVVFIDYEFKTKTNSLVAVRVSGPKRWAVKTVPMNPEELISPEEAAARPEAPPMAHVQEMKLLPGEPLRVRLRISEPSILKARWIDVAVPEFDKP